MKKTKETLGIMEKIEIDDELLEKWDTLSDQAKEMFREIDAGRRVPDLLNDVIFRGVFDPNIKPEWLSKFISSVIGKEVKIKNSLERGGRKRSINSKGIIMDIVVEFEDGEIADVEIQRKGLKLPPKRSAVYSSEILTRQYAGSEDELLGGFDYDRVHPVHMIIIMENSPRFLKSHLNYQHHFCQTSDTGIVSGVDFELLQYYHYMCLDVFAERRPRVADMLEKWLEFLSIRDAEQMMGFLADNPEFEVLYSRAVDMMADRSELMKMFESYFDNEDVIASMNMTNESIIRRLEKQLREQDDKYSEQIHMCNKQLREQSAEIERLKRELAEAKSEETAQ